MPRYRIAPGVDPREAPLLIPGRTPHVCPNGHCMDPGYLNCPCCGAYRAPRSVVVTHDFTHTTVDGVRYGIDIDGVVTAPDGDGKLDQLNIGRVRRKLDLTYGTQTRWWDATPYGDGEITTHRTRREAIRHLAETFR